MAEFVKVTYVKQAICDFYFKTENSCRNCPLYFDNNGEEIGCQRFCDECPENAEKIIMNWEKSIDWAKVEVDTPILVRDSSDKKWDKRHFAKYQNGYVYAWKDGTTSWSAKSKSDCLHWEYAKLADAEGERNERNSELK